MDDTKDKDKKVFNTEKYLTFLIQENVFWSNLRVCVEIKANYAN